MQTEDRSATLARQLLGARQERQPIPSRPWEGALANTAEAYAVQDAVIAALDGSASPARYWKSGGSSRETVLTHAPLPACGVRSAPIDFADLPFNTIGIEAEIALRLASDVTPEQARGIDGDRARPLIDAMAASIEIVDSRWAEGGRAPALLRLADLQSHGALALGAWQPFAARDWPTQRCRVTIGEASTAFVGTHALGDPCWLLPQWLRHATRHGATLPAGTVVTTGTWCGLMPAARGDLLTVAFDGIGELSVRL